MQVFENRLEAGRQLGATVRGRLGEEERPVVLAIPRGGLPVGAEVAAALGAPLDVVVVRKLRSPDNPELGFGAVGPNGHVDIDDELVARIGLSQEQVEAEIADRRAVVAQRLELYRQHLPPADLDGACAIIVDDGIATGGTARRACVAARRGGAHRVVLAVPVGPAHATTQFADVTDDVVILSQPAEFLAVGQAYRDFAQLDDEAALAAARRADPSQA